MGLRGRITILTESIRISEWVDEQNRGGHVCACGCGAPIQVERRHHWRGVLRYLHGHHPKVTTREVQVLRDEGLLTATVVARELGIGHTTLRRLEGQLFAPAVRRGKRRIRVFTREQVEQIRDALRNATRLGSEPGLLSVEEVARRAGCSASTPAPPERGAARRPTVPVRPRSRDGGRCQGRATFGLVTLWPSCRTNRS